MTDDLREVLGGPTLVAARALIGCRLVREDAGGRRVGRIVEVEAYIGQDDRASHARFGRTARNAVMFGPPGVAYVYLVYGMYDCLNVVTEPVGRAAAILVRAVESVEGEGLLREARLRHEARRTRSPEGAARAATRLMTLPPERLASGPGLVAAAFDIRREETGADLLDPAGSLRLEPGPPDDEATVVAAPRVGIGYAVEPWRSLPWRFLDADSPAVSGPRPRRTSRACAR